MNPSSKSENLKIEVVDGSHGIRILKLSGPFTLQTLFEFQQMARQEAAHPIVVDITDVPYMDSAGLGCVISVFASCQRTNRGFALIGSSPRIKTLFEVTHVDGLLPCFESLDAAEAAVAKSGS